MSFHSYHHPSCNQSKPINQSIIIIYRRTMQKDKRQFNKIKKNIQAVNSKRWNNQNQFISYHHINQCNNLCNATQTCNQSYNEREGERKESQPPRQYSVPTTRLPRYDVSNTLLKFRPVSLSLRLFAQLQASANAFPQIVHCRKWRLGLGSVSMSMSVSPPRQRIEAALAEREREAEYLAGPV